MILPLSSPFIYPISRKLSPDPTLQWNKDIKQVSPESLLHCYLYQAFIWPLLRPLAVPSLSPPSRVFGFEQSAPVGECVLLID